MSKFNLSDRAYHLMMAEKLMKEKFSHRGWADKQSFIEHKYHAEKLAGDKLK